MPQEPQSPTPVPRAVDRHAVTADRGDNAVRLDLVLLRHLGGPLALSRRALQRAIENGDVTVNGVVVTRTAARVATADRIDATLPAPVRRVPAQPQDLSLEVLFEDEHLLAVNKPAGIVTHPSYKHADGTLFNALLWHLRATPLRPRLLGRLDKDTSGVVLVSKTRLAHAGVVNAMRAGKVRKEYLAVVHGAPRPSSGEIGLSLHRDPADVRRVTVSDSEGKQSLTRYDTLSFGWLRPPGGNVRDDGSGVTRMALMRCELVTGRMHQIRVHLAARGWPIVGDRTYGAGLAGLAHTARHALHAWRVSLAHPVTGDHLAIIAPVPADIRELMDAATLTMHDPD
jgi:23S rRNA pseudouridine1911/1915/1917 synthase